MSIPIGKPNKKYMPIKIHDMDTWNIFKWIFWPHRMVKQRNLNFLYESASQVTGLKLGTFYLTKYYDGKDLVLSYETLYKMLRMMTGYEFGDESAEIRLHYGPPPPGNTIPPANPPPFQWSSNPKILSDQKYYEVSTEHLPDFNPSTGGRRRRRTRSKKLRSKSRSKSRSRSRRRTYSRK